MGSVEDTDGAEEEKAEEGRRDKRPGLRFSASLATTCLIRSTSSSSGSGGCFFSSSLSLDSSSASSESASEPSRNLCS